ncbi:MAG: mobile mystery protein B [SAR324 cluster bacterium]
MNEFFPQPDGAATPLEEEEKRDLKLDYIANRGDLNAAEQEDILRGREWAMRRKRDVLSDRFIKDLHRHMLGDVWKWAGKYRTTQRNIGVDYWEISVAMHNALEDAKTWIEKQTYPPDEIAVRIHHRLVQIHAFPNGNGRHARLMADLLAQRFGNMPFSWGKGSLGNPGELRKRYVDALRAADRQDIGPLLEFARR